MNPILALAGNLNQGKMILLQAFKAMVSGESAEDFMKKLVKSRPELQGLDLNDLEGTAHKLSAEKGLDENQLAKQIQSVLPKN